MNPKLNQPWIPLDRIEAIVQLEPALVIIALCLIAWLIYRFFLKEASFERHRNLKNLFLNLLAHGAIFVVFFILYVCAQRGVELGRISERVTSYFGLAALIAGAIVFVKVSRILLFEYLFIGHMRAGVPVLIVNLFTLMLSIGLSGWFAADIFGVKLTPLLATSAIFSLVLGLALQDTLGNLFAGVALQLDKPFEIGDWVEVTSTGPKIIGQVHEISWRATILLGVFDEQIILPNRIISGAEISNFSATRRPIWRSQTFRIPYGTDINQTKIILQSALGKAEGIRRVPEPIVNVWESTESWLLFRTSYTIDDYGRQWRIATNVITAVVEELQNAGQSLAASRLQVVRTPENEGGVTSRA